MKWCFTLGFIFAALGAAVQEDGEMDPPSVEGMDPSQIEKIMIQELLDKPKGSKKEAFNFQKTVKPILAKFKKQMLADKRKMQSSLNKDVATIKKCISKMKRSTRLGLLETEDESADEKKKEEKVPIRQGGQEMRSKDEKIETETESLQNPREDQ